MTAAQLLESPTSLHLLYLVLGLGLGGTIGWLFAMRWLATHSSETPLEKELRQQLAQRDATQTLLQGQLEDCRDALTAAEAKRAALQQALLEQRQWHDQALAAARDSHQTAIAELKTAFKALSAQALQETHPAFLRLAQEVLSKHQEAARGDLNQRQESIAGLVKPLEEHLRLYQQRLAQSEVQQSSALGAVRKHLETLTVHSQTLSAETYQLRRVLSSNQARGRWGEETLRRVVEAAGLSSHCDFAEQTQSGDSKPDLIVRLPGERLILVDAKVPDLEFLDAIDAADGPGRDAALAAHVTKLKATIKALGDRDYPRQFPNALDYVVMFLPAESLFSYALEADRNLIVWAANRRIMLSTPASLIALLRSVSVSWQQHAQTENSRAIAEAAQELFTRVVRFTEHLEKVRAGLERANNAFNDAVGSYEKYVRPSGERLEKLGATKDKILPELQPTTDRPRLTR